MKKCHVIINWVYDGSPVKKPAETLTVQTFSSEDCVVYVLHCSPNKPTIIINSSCDIFREQFEFINAESWARHKQFWTRVWKKILELLED